MGGSDFQKDVVETFIRASGPGGQKVNKTSSCVQLCHRPTGIVIKCQEFRSQDKNRTRAWEILRRKLHALEVEKKARLKAQIEKKKRQNRKRSRGAKEIMLQNKKRRSVIKANRNKVKDMD